MTCCGASDKPSKTDPDPSWSHYFIVFVNKKSGGLDGVKLEQRVRDILSDRRRGQIILLQEDIAGSTDSELRSLGRTIKKKSRGQPVRAVVAGGDGSIRWVEDVIATMGMLSVPICLLPIGTGNEMGGTMGWGKAFNMSSNLYAVFKNFDQGPVATLDNWSVEIEFDDGDVATEDLEMSSFLSVGFDAYIANKFHKLRQRKPGWTSSRGLNKFYHVVYGLGVLFKQRPWLNDHVELSVDGKHIKFPRRIRCLHVLNIRTTGDLDIFKGDKPKPGKHDLLKKFDTPSFSDGQLEVCATLGPLHLVKMRSVPSMHAIRLAQGSEIEITITKATTMQMEGEPRDIEPCRITITPSRQRLFVTGPGYKSSTPGGGNQPTLAPTRSQQLKRVASYSSSGDLSSSYGSGSGSDSGSSSGGYGSSGSDGDSSESTGSSESFDSSESASMS